MHQNANDGSFRFGAWQTPFENEWVEILECSYSGTSDQLVIRVETDSGVIYHLEAEISAFRVQDEGGLMEFWNKPSEFGNRPALATFKVRNSHWAKESVAPFLPSNGWSYVLATQSTCIDFATIGDAIPFVTVE